MSFLQNHWGDLFSLLGVVVSGFGLFWAIRVAQAARSAAQAAEEGAIEARDRIGRHLLAVDLERAVALIQRLKLLHREGLWEAALEQYQALRAMLSSIVSHHTELDTDRRRRLIEFRGMITLLEQSVEKLSARGQPSVEDFAEMNSNLNRIQVDLEDMASASGLDAKRGGTQHG